MPRSKTAYAAILIAVFFCIGVARLFTLRFEAGDIYPPYSSLRNDPLGTRALFESLNNLDSIRADRNFDLLQNIPPSSDACIFFIGLHPSRTKYLDKASFNMVERSVAGGGRAVISFLPVSSRSEFAGFEDLFKLDEKKDKKEEEDEDEEKTESEKKTDEDEKVAKDEENKESGEDEKNEQNEQDEHDIGKQLIVSLEEKWKLTFAYDEIEKNAKAYEVGTGRSIIWHSALWFDGLEEPWKTVYSLDGKPVIIERKLGRGSVVISSDSYFFSNEALRNEPSPGLLVRMAGGFARVVFDESHHGIRINRGMIDLISKFELHWLIFAALAFALLFVWKNSLSFVPPVESGETGKNGVVSEKDAAQGLTSLLRRNIGTNELLKICLSEWKKSFSDRKGISSKQAERLDEIERKIAAGSRFSKKDDIVDGYNEIARIINERKI